MNRPILPQAGAWLRNDPWLPAAVALFLAALGLALPRLDSLPLVAGVAVVLALTAAIVRRPVWGTWLTAFLAPSDLRILGANPMLGSTRELGNWESFFNVTPCQIAALATAGAVVLGILTGRRRWVRSPVGAPILALLALSAGSVFVSDYQLESVRQVVKLALGILPGAWILFQTVRHRREALVTLLAFLSGATVSAFVGVLQTALLALFDLPLFPNQTPLPNGLTGESSGLGLWSADALALLLPLLLARPPRRALTLALAAFTLLLAVVILTASRTAWLELAVIGTLVAAWGVRGASERRVLALVGVCVLATVVVAGTALLFIEDTLARVVERATWRETSFDVRLLMLHAAYETWAHPLWGNGVGTFFPTISARYPPLFFAFENRGGSAFNLFLGALYDNGILGLLVLLWLLQRVTSAWWRAWNAPRDMLGQAFFLAGTNLLVCQFINAQIAIIWDGTNAVLFALALVLLRLSSQRAGAPAG